MRHVLRIARNLTLDLGAVTKMIGILAMRGMGKSYTASVLTEQLLKAGAHVVVVDPLGVFWGLRSSEDGRHEGLPIPIFGGDHADVPLDPASGATVADLVVNERLSVVLDLSRMTPADAARFMLTFAERLYHKNRKPLHLILDEADEWAPQHPMHGKERLLGAVENLVRRGRARGIGVTLVTQRSAVINKNVLSQVDLLIAMRTVAPQDRAAIDAWVKANGDEAGRRQVMDSLASLEVGEAWFWSPGWLGSLVRGRVNRRETFDSSATPKMGVRVREPKRLSPVDLERIKGQMASTIEQARREDPRELRARVTQLEREIETSRMTYQQQTNAMRELSKTTRERVVEKKVPWLGRKEIAALQKATAELERFADAVVKHTGMFQGFQATVESLNHVARRLEAPIDAAMKSLRRQGGVSISVSDGMPHSGRTGAFDHPTISGRSAYQPIGRDDTLRLDPAAARVLRGKRIPFYDKDKPEFGAQFVGEPKQDTTLPVRERPAVEDPSELALKAGAVTMLATLSQFHPQRLTRTQLGTLTGFTASGGTFLSYLSKLKKLDLVHEDAGGLTIVAWPSWVGPLKLPTMTPERVLQLWRGRFKAGVVKMLDLLVIHTNGLPRQELGEKSGFTASGGTFLSYLSQLRHNGLIVEEGNVVKLSDDVFLGVR